MLVTEQSKDKLKLKKRKMKFSSLVNLHLIIFSTLRQNFSLKVKPWRNYREYFCFPFKWRSYKRPFAEWYVYFFSQFPECAEGSKTRHADGHNGQFHLCSLLGNRINRIRFKISHISRNQLCSNNYCWHDGFVQFSCKPLCVCPPESSVQAEDQGSDVLHTPRGAQAAGWNSSGD